MSWPTSIAARGLIQPIVVRPHGHDYQIVAGERRWRAAQRARLHEVPVIVRDFDDAETLEIALVENIQRQDLNAIEEAQAYQRLIERFRPYPGSARQARPQVAQPRRQSVAPARSSRRRCRQHVVEGALSMGHARALIGAPDVERWPTGRRRRACRCARPSGLPAPPSPSAQGAPATRRDAAAMPISPRSNISSPICSGLKVRIAHGPKGGTLTLALFHARSARHDLPATERRAASDRPRRASMA